VDIRQLRHFVSVCEHGSIAAAARLVHVAQPALSRQMTNLEEDLGALLFHRLPRGIALTPPGEMLLIRARETVTAFDRLVADVKKTATGTSGSLRIGVVPNYGWLPIIHTLISSLREKTPDIRIFLEPHLSQEQHRLLQAGELNAGFVAWLPPESGGLLTVPVHEDRFALVMPKHRHDFYGRVPPLAELVTDPFVMFPRRSAPTHFDAIMRIFSNAGLQPNIVQWASDTAAVMG